MRVLLATDGSPSSDVGIDLIRATEWPDATKIRVVEAIDTSAALLNGTWPDIAMVDIDRLEAEFHDHARATVDAAAARLARPGLEVTASVLLGRAPSAIVEAAETTDADLVILGSRGHGSIESMVLGSVSSEVVDHAAVPVLVARRSTVRRVVLAWDGSACAQAAAAIVRAWPMFRHAEVRVVSVADVRTPWWTGMPAAGSPQLMPMYVEASDASRRVHTDLAAKMALELSAAGIDAHHDAREGDAASEIIRAAADRDADLIVLGTHGRTGLSRLLLGSVARNVLHHAAASVLIAREPARDR